MPGFLPLSRAGYRTGDFFASSVPVEAASREGTANRGGTAIYNRPLARTARGVFLCPADHKENLRSLAYPRVSAHFRKKDILEETKTMGEVKLFSGEKLPLEMHKVRVVQKLNLLPVEARQ